MMLSSIDIRQAMAAGDLVIDPLFATSIRPAGLTLHLGEHLLKPLGGTVVDIRKRISPQYQQILITDEEPYRLEPGEFLLGHTLEKVTVGSKLGFFIEGRSTLARLGLTVVQTAMLVDPGHRGRAVTLELANHGPNPILLYPRLRVARAALFELKSPAERQYDDFGKYRVQPSVGAPIFETEFAPEEGK